MHRRSVLLGAVAVAVLSGCSAEQATSFAMAKSYIDAAIRATLAASQQYLISTPPPSAASAAIVKTVAADLAQVKVVLDATVAGTTWQTVAQSAIADITQLVPIVGPYLGAGAMAGVELALGVVAAYIAALPPPADAPPTPPASLVRKSLEYHHE